MARSDRARRRLLAAETVLAAGCFLFALLAAGSRLSSQRRRAEQNILGGYGSLISEERSRSVIRPLLADDTNIYYPQRKQGKNSLGAKAHSGETRDVCTRVLCDHKTADCPLYPLYETKHLEYFAIDGKLYFPRIQGDALRLVAWDPLTGRQKNCWKGDAQYILYDEDGTEVCVVNAILALERLNAETLLLQTGRETYLLNNDFSVRYTLAVGSGKTFAWTENALFYILDRDFTGVSLTNGKMRENILHSHAQEENAPLLFGRGDLLYFASGSRILSYDFAQDEIAVVLTDSDLPMFSLFGDCIYYMKDAVVTAYDLTSGRETPLPQLPRFPDAKIGDVLCLRGQEGLLRFTTKGVPLTP